MSEASEVGVARRTSGACAELSEAKIVSKGDKEGGKMDALPVGAWD